MSKNVRRRGFTLPEVLVTITIVAVLAAVVVPAVLNQVNKGDTAGLSGDIDALRSAISSFTTDTRHFPRTIDDLVNSIGSTDDDLFAVDYGTAAQNAWKGPYFPTSQDVSVSYLTSAYNLTIATAFDTRPDTNGNFLTLRFSGSGATAANVAVLDRLFDSGTGTVPTGANTASCATASAGSTSGQIRWTEGPGSSPTTDPCVITNLRWRLVSAIQ